MSFYECDIGYIVVVPSRHVICTSLPICMARFVTSSTHYLEHSSRRERSLRIRKRNDDYLHASQLAPSPTCHQRKNIQTRTSATRSRKRSRPATKAASLANGLRARYFHPHHSSTCLILHFLEPQTNTIQAQFMASEYKKRGGGYTEPKDETQKHLSQWSAEEWQTRDGSGTAKQEDGSEARYLPKKAWEGMSEKEKDETEEKKKEGDEEGKQFVENTRRAKEERGRAQEDVEREEERKEVKEEDAGSEMEEQDEQEEEIKKDAEEEEASEEHDAQTKKSVKGAKDARKRDSPKKSKAAAAKSAKEDKKKSDDTAGTSRKRTLRSASSKAKPEVSDAAPAKKQKTNDGKAQGSSPAKKTAKKPSSKSTGSTTISKSTKKSA